MPADSQLIDWGLKAVMGLVSVFVFLLGRDVKRSEEMISAKATAVQQEFRLELQLRDQRLDAIEHRQNRAGQKASDEADRVTVKVADLDHRLVVVEARLEQLSS